MKMLKNAFGLSIVLIIICGIIYPLSITGIGQLLFPKQSNGSIITSNGKSVGSELIGQNFTDARFFRGRVSAINYNTYTEADIKSDADGKKLYSGVSSGSENLSPSNKVLAERVQKDINDFLKVHPHVKKEDIPTDLLTSSGSGLDPDISPKAAEIQIASVSKATGISKEELQKIVNKYTEGKIFGIFGEPRVNVLKVNLEIASMLNK
ncbi:K(+)-transporting ATPase subunit C [Clostridium pasteurianum]|uniref:K(+)-transporting ATPase subunit C n=1 Tax=Clostridium pasteurianum TaxID=1501 RepID=UPI0008DBA615|nr:K(+)-transporting ATPase subunit C [Clostridium pasteurianum]AOZ80277.1 potassium-transporting ATPase subunit C [Clostridium pasteurianum]